MGQSLENVRIVNVVDGSVIEGREAVEAYFEKERRMLEKYGATVNFQLYRANLCGRTRQEIQGPRIAEYTIAGAEISGDDTVADVKAKILPALCAGQAPAKYVTFTVSGHAMEDDSLFYADNFLLLPTWIQVLLSDVSFPSFMSTYLRAPAEN